LVIIIPFPESIDSWYNYMQSLLFFTLHCSSQLSINHAFINAEPLYPITSTAAKAVK